MTQLNEKKFSDFLFCIWSSSASEIRYFHQIIFDFPWQRIFLPNNSFCSFWAFCGNWFSSWKYSSKMNFEFLHCQDIILASLTHKIIIKCCIRLKTNFRTDQQWLSLLMQCGAGYLIEGKDGGWRRRTSETGS